MATENKDRPLTIAVDAMGGDKGPSEVLAGCAEAIRRGLTAELAVFGREDELEAGKNHSELAGHPISYIHAEDVIKMDDKPSRVLRRSKGTSMWQAIGHVKEGHADGIVSCGNTGALMAISRMQLKMIPGVDRPAASALWPSMNGHAVVLDVGANVEVTAEQLVQFAIMGEAYCRALMETDRPRVGLLNVGEEDLKGSTLIKNAAKILREADPEMNFTGFVEGDDISRGEVDVVVTDGFTGNVALKTAEGTARMIGDWVKEALTANLLSKAGAALMMPSLKRLKARMDPASVNGAPLLGLNGLVVKSHGGSTAEGFASALMKTEKLAKKPFIEPIAKTVAKVTKRAENVEVEELTQAAAE
ncbi:phosphate acyltransferase PlsX [Parvularcula sp. ZS-1/3]|uniref:Phosphate acyltransferase n=1 Tax=Parvularcula mediterranea TaxID=2732508 RepID=A0A7Y3RME4_9PROT|nr:phosphate acyltransferase PlsX [Parvularcula mediterranea]NNU16786.1 phosphate acyltransferase PlsX [Parvularcula mediterranea]